MDSRNYIDSLPYIDHEYDDPIAREQVLDLVQEEMRRVSPPAVPKSTAMFKNSEILRKEYERVRSGKALPAFDIDRYNKLAGPENEHDEEAWKQAANNAASQLEHQEIRIENLELLQSFGANAWKLSNYQKEQILQSIEAATKRYHEEGAHINKARKYEQTEAAITLQSLEEQWSEGVRRCIEIQVASSQLQQEIRDLEQQQLAEQKPNNSI
ncbi:hypothetical protein IWW36_003917 [Coemansia brasiliensis]|uniref:Breast carcinoma amplified sequence 2 n=1 Tax=Coemansia brasiliensis TaxID=2650707 RepID=A0A9W8IBT4_9FUNG|nr:hypothetical protein IWW36_003917 [Coemansia brasiliensis]